MSEYARIAEHFKNDFAEATFQVCREDGIYRHIEFAAPKSMNRLTVVTWPYNLLVAGSHGSFHFERFGRDTVDMFDWLRSLRVDPASWSSKLVNGRSSVEEYDRDRMVAQINERVAEAVQDGWAPEGLEEAVREEIFGSHLLDTKDTAFQLVGEFEHRKMYRPVCSCGSSGNEGSYDSAASWKYFDHEADGKKHKVDIRQTGGFDFDDSTEWFVDRLNYHFVYQCHAIVWGIARYDKVTRYGLGNLAARKAVAA